MDKDGRAYTNTLVDGKVYGPDGTRIQSDNGWDIVTVEEDVYKDSDSAVPILRKMQNLL